MVTRDSSSVRWPVWIILAALIAAGGALHPSDIQPPFDPLRPLVQAAASAVSRDIAARLSGGFPWAPLREARGVHDVMNSALRAAASQLVRENNGDASAVPATPSESVTCSSAGRMMR